MSALRQAVFSSLAVWAVLTAPASTDGAVCVGDCDGNGEVAINELITGVGISLGNAELSTCPIFDSSGNDAVDINELIQAVNNALNGCEPDGNGAICGNGTVEEDEECDDGGLCTGTLESETPTACQSNEECGSDGPCKTFGGDGCAVNCTTERRRTAPLDPRISNSVAQYVALKIDLPLSGQQTQTTGGARETEVKGLSGEIITEPLQIPITIKAEDIQFDPIPVLGLVCACVRGVPVPSFGPGNSGVGFAGCGPDGLTDIDVLIVQDHNTTPGDENNSGPDIGLPDDPECDDTAWFGVGPLSRACLEGSDERCSEPDNTHGICQSPRVPTFSGGPAGRGSVLFFNNTAIALLSDESKCEERRTPEGDCQFEDYGPDCIPCTSDDLELGNPNIGPNTSGTIEVRLVDANNIPGIVIGDGELCLGVPCVARRTSGELMDCDAVLADPESSFGAKVVTGFPAFDSRDLGDSVTTTVIHAISD